MAQTIPSFWLTDRLAIADVTEDDTSEVTVVYEDTFTPEWCTRTPTPNWARKELESPVLPPNGLKENHKFQVIRLKSCAAAIGYMITDYGFKTPDSAWIADLFLLQRHTNRGYGREIVSHLIKEIRKLDTYNKIGCTVNLLNWPGIRFFTKIGFSNITAYVGDKDFGVRNDGNIQLEFKMLPKMKV